MTDVRSVALGCWVGVGARDEPAALAGASHFLEHLLFKGTTRRTARQIAEVIDATGGETDAFTARDHTVFSVRVLRQDLGTALDILCDIVWDPALRPDDVEAERRVILEELLLRGDEPEDLVQELLAEVMYRGHPLGREVLGTETTVAALSTDQLRAFHDRWYRPGAMVVAAAGALDHDELVVDVERRLRASGRPAGGERPQRQRPGGGGPSLVVQRRRTDQVHLAVGIPAPNRHDPDRHAAGLLAQIVGGGVSSRLFQEVRERRGLAYSVYAERLAFDDVGSMILYAGTGPERATEVLRVIYDELDRLTEGVTDREVEVAQGAVIGSFTMGLEDSGSRMARIGRSQLFHGAVPPVDEVRRRMEAVTVEDVSRVAGSVAGARRTVAAVGPVRKADLAAVTGRASG